MSRYRIELELELADDDAVELLASEIIGTGAPQATRAQVWREAEHPWLTSVLVYAWRGDRGRRRA